MRGQFCLWRVTLQSIERGVRGRPGKVSREGMARECGLFVIFTLRRNNVLHKSHYRSSFKTHQNRLGRLLTMGIPRPSLNILSQEVGWGPGNRIVSPQGKSSTAGSRTRF